jgi:hypothetical protein
MAKISWTEGAEQWLRDTHDHIAQDNFGAAAKETSIFSQL